MASSGRAVGRVVLVGDRGRVVAAGTRMKHGSLTFEVVAAHQFAADSEEAQVEVCATRVGTSSELAGGSLLQFEQEIEGVSSDVFVMPGGITVPSKEAKAQDSAAGTTKDAGARSAAAAAAPPAPTIAVGTLHLWMNGVGRTYCRCEITREFTGSGGERRFDVRAQLPSGRANLVDLPIYDPGTTRLPAVELAELEE